MNATKSSLIVAVPILCAATFLSACRSTPSQPSSTSASAPNTSVYLRLSGDPKLVHRFQIYAADEFEDAGLALTDNLKQADVTVSANFSTGTRTASFANGLVQMTAKAGVVSTDLSQCGSSSSDPNGKVFGSAGEYAASEILGKFPNAHTVSVDPQSNFDADPEFKPEFESTLQKRGKTVSGSKDADVVVTIKLEKRKISVEEVVDDYDVQIISSAGTATRNSSGVRSAKLVGDPLKVCAGDLTDLHWLETGSTSAVARQVARDIAKGRSK